MSYQQLLKLCQTRALLDSISNLLEWDLETHMPAQAIEQRAAHMELMASLTHKEKTSKKFARALGKLIDIETGQIKDTSLSAPHQAALVEWRRDYLRDIKLPAAFVRKFAQTTSSSAHAWKKAKERNNFSLFLPHLKKIVSLCRKKADILGYQEHPYDALVNFFEPEMKTSTLTALFSRLQPPLSALVQAIQKKPGPQISLKGSYDASKQLDFALHVLRAMGFDPEFSRLDLSAHPMCITIHPKDLRMTTRIYPDDPMPNILSAIHEGGHALYSHFLPQEEFGSPLCEPVSLGINESQSRFWETIIGRSLPFWTHFYPRLQEVFSQSLGSISLEQFYAALNTVKPTLIRTDADEVTYNLHIIARFELEKALIEGSIQVEEIPERWNGKISQFLGISPPSNREGCLQDIHWSLGAFGYFPTYTLGNLYAAQLFEKFTATHPRWQERVEAGDLSQIRQWLSQEIHRFGRQYPPEKLCEKVTGNSLSEKPFLRYLERKYRALYHVEQ
jgi:carboxypeptidase Taq